LSACLRHGKKLSREKLDDIVANNDKMRYAISDDGLRIRANQGHSVEVDLDYEPAEPPEFLYHGTPDKFIEAIKESGLEKRARHHVHLSEHIDTATAVGKRRGRPVILTIEAQRMRSAGLQFFVTPNGVWLTARVPVDYIVFPE
jgi:putative RNA 2'-phosphotransferase